MRIQRLILLALIFPLIVGAANSTASLSPSPATDMVSSGSTSPDSTLMSSQLSDLPGLSSSGSAPAIPSLKLKPQATGNEDSTDLAGFSAPPSSPVPTANPNPNPTPVTGSSMEEAESTSMGNPVVDMSTPQTKPVAMTPETGSSPSPAITKAVSPTVSNNVMTSSAPSTTTQPAISMTPHAGTSVAEQYNALDDPEPNPSKQIVPTPTSKPASTVKNQAKTVVKPVQPQTSENFDNIATPVIFNDTAGSEGASEASQTSAPAPDTTNTATPATSPSNTADTDKTQTTGSTTP